MSVDQAGKAGEHGLSFFFSPRAQRFLSLSSVFSVATQQKNTPITDNGGVRKHDGDKKRAVSPVEGRRAGLDDLSSQGDEHISDHLA
ncbi:MAG: hypothetical protein JW934_02060 [Anaerolineae bacterium]|nr:hypothetical protein [Anaerolineae bacterium]